MQTTRIKSIKLIGKQKTLDLEVDSVDHNFYAEGLVVSNSHAAAYSYLSALTLYLKYKYPQHFYTECLKMAVNKADSQEHIGTIQQELGFFGIQLLAPDLLKSKEDFSIEGKDIRYGFSSIKGVSEKSLSSLKTFLDAEKTNKFEVFNAAENSKLNVGIVCALAQAGMLSSLSSDREKTVLEAQVWSKLTDKEKVFCLKSGDGYNFDLLNMVKNIHSWVGENGKKVSAKTRLETIRKNCARYKEIYYQNKKYPDFASLVYEKSLLGYSYSQTLKGVFRGSRSTIMNSHEIKSLDYKGNIEGVFEVCEVKRGVSGRGNKYMKLRLQDETGSFDGMMVGEKYENYAQKEEEPKKGNIVFVTGQATEDIVWLNTIKIQDYKVFLRLADIK